MLIFSTVFYYMDDVFLSFWCISVFRQLMCADSFPSQWCSHRQLLNSVVSSDQITWVPIQAVLAFRRMQHWTRVVDSKKYNLIINTADYFSAVWRNAHQSNLRLKNNFLVKKIMKWSLQWDIWLSYIIMTWISMNVEKLFIWDL